MVAPRENLLSLDHQINMERHTFKTQKQKTLHLLQYCQKMQDGVMRAQHHNSQLLQQFEEAQGTLREMATLTAAMKATRMEYEKHLVGIPQWRQQLQENTREKRNLNNPGNRTYSSPDQPLPSQLSYDGSFYPPHIQPSWTMHPRNPYQLQDSSHAPHLSSSSLQLHHRASGLNLHQVLPCHNVPDQPWFWTAAVAGIPSGSEAKFCKTEPPAESWPHSQASSALSSYRKSVGSRNSRSAQELDTQPVRLSCSAESSDDTTETSQLNGKKRGKPKHTSDREHRSPDFQDFTVVRTGGKVAQSSGSTASPEESRSSSKGEGPNGGPLKVENGVKEREDKKNEDSRSSSEESRREQTGREESETPRENCGSVNIKMKTGRSGVKNEEVKDDKRLKKEDPEESDEEAKSDENERQKEKEVPKRSKSTDGEEEDAGAEEEMEEQESEESGGMKDKDNRRLDSASSQEEVDEDKNEVSEDDESDEDKKTQDSSYDAGEMEMAKEKKGAVAAQGEDESDSDECIISLHKSKMLHIIPEEAPEDEGEEEDKPGNSEEGSDESSDDDIEDLLAPQKAPKTQEKEMNPEQKAKGSYDRMQIFQVDTKEGTSHGDHPSDSDEFDHFFD